MGLIDATTLISAFTDVKNVKNDGIDSIKGIFFRVFIIKYLIGCYNITLCNNITFRSQAIYEHRKQHISKIT